MASTDRAAPPGLDKFSLWPARQHRRHIATAAHNAQVLASIVGVSNHLEPILSQLQSFEVKLSQLESMTRVVLDKLEVPVLHGPNLDTLEKRVDGMELFLFQSSLKDFQRMDKFVSTVLEEYRLEKEASSCSSTVILDGTNCCTNFDIFSDAGEQNGSEVIAKESHESMLPHTTENEHLQLAWEIAEAVQLEAQQLQADDKFQEYSALIGFSFGQIFASMPTSPVNELSQHDFEEEYGDIHLCPIWKAMCRKYFGGDTDPLKKPALAIEAMSIVDSLRTKSRKKDAG